MIRRRIVVNTLHLEVVFPTVKHRLSLVTSGQKRVVIRTPSMEAVVQITQQQPHFRIRQRGPQEQDTPRCENRRQCSLIARLAIKHVAIILLSQDESRPLLDITMGFEYK